jgi:hypothetical protein
VRAQWDDEALGGRNRGGERQNTTSLVLLTCPVDVLAKRLSWLENIHTLFQNTYVDDTSNTERRLNHVGSVLPHVLHSCALLNLDQLSRNLNLAITNAGHVNDNLALLLQVERQLLAQILRQRLNGRLDRLSVLLELGAKLLLLDIALPLLNLERLLPRLADNKRRTRLLHVHSQVVRATVGTANALDPAVRCQQLGVPAVCGVMGHLVGHVLPEADLLGVDTNLEQELLDTGKEVSERLVVHQTGLDSLANLGRLDFGLARQLDVAVEELELNVLDLVEAGMLLATLGVDIVLNLGHEELANTQQTGTRGDFVTERLADRGRGEGHLRLVELEQLVEVEELALGRLGAQVAGHVGRGTNRGLEHEVEGDGGLELAVGGRVLDVVLLHELAELLAVVVVDLGQDLLVLLDDGILELDNGNVLDLLLLLLGVLLLSLDLLATGLLVALEAGLENLLDQVVGAEDLASLGVLAHPVGELVDVAGCLEDLVGGQHGAVDLEHVLLEHEVLAPDIDNVVCEGAAGRAIVVETRDTAVDVEGGRVEKAALHRRESIQSHTHEL